MRRNGQGDGRGESEKRVFYFDLEGSGIIRMMGNMYSAECRSCPKRASSVHSVMKDVVVLC